MASALRLAIAVLAAGGSQRFGAQDKLTAAFGGSPLGMHATDKLSRLRADTRFVVAQRSDHVCAEGWHYAGFDVVANPDAEQGMGTSVAVAGRIARRAGVDALMIALADMPLVPTAHYRALAKAALIAPADAIVASSDGNTAMPPAVFGAAHFGTLAAMTGDSGARDLLRQAETIECPPEWLVDIDTPEALAEWD